MTQPMLQLETDSPEATETAAQEFARRLAPGQVVILDGPLGAGKTLFVRAVARELGSPDPVSSPTFVLEKRYRTPEGCAITGLVHYDAYRLATYAELADLGFEDLDESEVAFVEWGGRFLAEIPSWSWRVVIEPVAMDRRRVVVKSRDEEPNS